MGGVEGGRFEGVLFDDGTDTLFFSNLVWIVGDVESRGLSNNY